MRDVGIVIHCRRDSMPRHLTGSRTRSKLMAIIATKGGGDLQLPRGNTEYASSRATPAR